VCAYEIEGARLKILQEILSKSYKLTFVILFCQQYTEIAAYTISPLL